MFIVNPYQYYIIMCLREFKNEKKNHIQEFFEILVEVLESHANIVLTIT